ncbi:MAG TPA: sigma-70 family RNA polymerase sigma factor [Hanamia sp.]
MLQQENHKKLLELIRCNEGIIFNICNSYCNNKTDREDLAQEIVYQLLKSYRSFNDSYKFSTWMYRVALNVAISFYRKNKKENKIELAEDQHGSHDEMNGHAFELEQNLVRLRGFINELKELDKALMILYLESKSYNEIAEIMGITETNVATKISRIKEALRKNFSNLNK